ncbi:hypothetical protein [Haliangium ochraceum]|uniref:Uncharacterized protein n=1 Tax=Haliangium ochraceum (strain DSM 14365 / JCM 11303 / SMP-2) TaxID=502025 RepID=D0LX70_HALO1|nr:hypothetical protein [Haliangium ochraceum]ACY16112.1 hypothetical protein Hoch_3610 [Haliangium ochraceum DSM 14365]
MSSEKGHKRINFFKGFLTTEQDWNDAERYHIDKRKLHNRRLHAPGVVRGYGGDLRVVARSRGDLSVEVQSGYAIDGAGQDLILWDARIKNINPEEYRLPQTIYVVLRFTEELTDFIAYKENLEYKGHRRVLEGATVELSQTEPDIHREVELARIYVEKGATRVRDARDPLDPRANEIDMRYVPQAGIAGSFLQPALRLRMENVLWQIRKTFVEYARRQILCAHDVLQATHTALMLNASNMVDMRNVFEIFHLIVESEGELCLDVDVNQPTIAQKKEFSDFKRHVEILRGLLDERKDNMEAFTNLLAFQSKANEVAEAALIGEKAVLEAPPEKVEEKPKNADIKDWEEVKKMPHPPETLDLDGITWVLVDQISILDKDSEEKHEFGIHDAKDSYRSRQKLKYPDGSIVEDTGRAHVGGNAVFKIMNLTAGRPAVVLRRMDYVYGDYEIEYLVNDNVVGTVSCSGTDRVHRWRNWPFMIEGEHVTEDSLRLKQVAVTAGRDVNMFHIWVYQPT